MTITLSPQTETLLSAAAQTRGVPIETLIDRIAQEQFAPVETSPGIIIDAENAAAIAYLNRRLQEEATDDPDEIRKSEEEVEELMYNLNKNRIDSGERPLFP